MTRQSAFLGILLGVGTFVACDGDPQAPTPIAQPPAAPPVAAPPATNPAGSAIAGAYTLTLDLGSGCAAISEADRTRRYSASIDPSADGRYVVTLSDATFLTGLICTAHSSGLGCHQFFASESDGMVRFSLENNNDDAHGGHIVERSASGTWMEIIGEAAGRVAGSTIEASGNSSVWYCGTPSAYPFPCAEYASCSSTDMRLTLTRR